MALWDSRRIWWSAPASRLSIEPGQWYQIGPARRPPEPIGSIDSHRCHCYQCRPFTKTAQTSHDNGPRRHYHGRPAGSHSIRWWHNFCPLNRNRHGCVSYPRWSGASWNSCGALRGAGTHARGLFSI